MKKEIVRGSLAVFIGLLLSKFAAFLQEIVIAAYLGATETGDAFNTVFRVQQTIYPMLAVGISQVFIPAYKTIMTKDGDKKADSLANYTIVFFTGISVIIVILLIFFAPLVVFFVAPGFNDIQRSLTTHLVRISAASYVFVCSASIISSMLMAYGRFFISEVRAVFSHLPVIIAAHFFYRIYGITALAIALVVGGILRLVIQLPFLHRGYKFSLTEKPDGILIKSLLKKWPSALISSGITQTNSLVDGMMASTFVIGSVSCLNYGMKVYSVLQELFANIISVASYPQIIELIAQDKKKELSDLFIKMIGIIWLLTIPVTIGGTVFSRELMETIFVRGAFTIEMSRLAAGVFVGYVIALPFTALHGILNNVYFGCGDTKTPMLLNLMNLGLNIIFNFVFSHFFDVAGLAIATSVSSVLCLVVRIALLKRYMEFGIGKICGQTVKIFLSAVISIGVAFIVTRLFSINNSLFICGFVVLISAILYFLGLFLLRVPIFEEAKEMLIHAIVKRL